MTNNASNVGINKIRTLIRESSHFYIAGHTNPDGDCIGACFALGLALEKIGKKARVLLEPFHHKYNVIPGQHLMYTQGTVCGPGEPCLQWPETVLICVDCADKGRLSGNAKTMAEALPCIISIDHHYSNTYFADYNYVDGKASSTCELIYRILDGFVSLDQDIATALYAGIVGDTGGFRYDSTSQGTLQAIGNLVALDIPFTDIYTELLHRRSYTEIKLFARVLEACRRNTEGSVIYACVTRQMMTGFEDAPDATTQDLEGMVESLLNVRGAKVALLVYDCSTDGDAKDGEVKVSLRSRKVNVGAIAQQLGGGGHHLAAGATVKGDIFEVCDKALSLIYKDI